MRLINADTSNSKNNAKHLTILFVFSALMVLFYLCTAQYDFAGGAGSFFTYAQVIISGQHTLDITQREIGFPLMLVLSGFPWTGSIIGITLIHALMAFLTPLLVYVAVGRSHPRAAFLAGLMCILSLTPYQFIKMMYHDQTYLFFTTLSITLFACYSRTGKLGYLYALTFAILITSFTRPAGNLAFPILMVCAYIGRQQSFRHFFICTVIFAILAFANYSHRFYILGVTDKHAIPSYTGHQIFYNVYLNAAEYGVVLSPSMGPAMQRFYHEIQQAYAPNPSIHPALIHYKTSNPKLYEAAFHFTDAATLAQRFLDRPMDEYVILFQAIPSMVFDSSLFMQTSWEVIRQHPLYPLQYTLRNLKYYFLAPGYNHPLGTDTITMRRHSPEYYPRVGDIAIEAGLTEKAKAEMSGDPLNGFFSFLRIPEVIVHHLWRAGYNLLLWITVILTGLGVAHSIKRLIQRRNQNALQLSQAATEDNSIVFPLLGAFMLLFYNAVVTCVFVDPLYRYQYMTMPIQIICAGYGLVVLRHFIAKHDRNK